jgi:monoamine oxidase
MRRRISDRDRRVGGRCWTARRTADNAELTMPARPEGCTIVRDFAGLWDIVIRG